MGDGTPDADFSPSRGRRLLRARFVRSLHQVKMRKLQVAESPGSDEHRERRPSVGSGCAITQTLGGLKAESHSHKQTTWGFLKHIEKFFSKALAALILVEVE
ncbi:hypothetical protein J6590_032665 [Homalodisca vitripennis]|nr:hypothetical protein J6590_032665 [Homalodisca vitripennis]